MRRIILSGLLFVLVFNFSYAQTQKIYKVDVKKSNIVWAARKIGSDHEGTINFKSGELKFKDKYLVGGTFIVDMNSIKNTDIKDKEQNQKLVNHLKTADFFAVDKFPEAKLEIINADRKLNQDYFITANLTIKGKTNKIKMPVVIQVIDEENVYTRVSMTFDRTKFDVVWGSSSLLDKVGDVVVYDDVDLNIEIFAEKE